MLSNDYSNNVIITTLIMKLIASYHNSIILFNFNSPYINDKVYINNFHTTYLQPPSHNLNISYHQHGSPQLKLHRDDICIVSSHQP